MGQAIRDDRTAHAAANAAAIAEARNIRQDPNVTGALNSQSGTGAQSRVPPPDPGGPSYPVYVDPVGVKLGQTRLGNVGYANSSYGIQRVSIDFGHPGPPLPMEIARWFTSLDDMEFRKDGLAGTPVLVPGTTNPLLERTNLYSWAYLVRRPRSSVSSVADLTVVVYSGRAAQLPLGEYYYGPPNSPAVGFNSTTNFVDVPYTGEKPPLRKGSWIMDCTMVKPIGGGANGTQVQAEPHGYFYRVVGVTDDPGVMHLELQAPPRAPSILPNGTKYGCLLVMDNVVEIFEKGSGWQP
jgi:hypothetical protein